MSVEEDLLAEGEPEREFNAGIAARLPGKSVAAGALIRDGEGRILLIDPVYKDDWILPGGIVEAGEDPVSACIREVREELGADLIPGPLLVVDWVPAHGPWGDSLKFVFDCGVLTHEQLAGLTLQPEEVRGAFFVTLGEATPHLRPSMARRVAACLVALEQGQPHYLEFGRAMTS